MVIVEKQLKYIINNSDLEYNIEKTEASIMKASKEYIDNLNEKK